MPVHLLALHQEVDVCLSLIDVAKLRQFSNMQNFLEEIFSRASGYYVVVEKCKIIFSDKLPHAPVIIHFGGIGRVGRLIRCQPLEALRVPSNRGKVLSGQVGWGSGRSVGSVGSVGWVGRVGWLGSVGSVGIFAPPTRANGRDGG